MNVNLEDWNSNQKVNSIFRYFYFDKSISKMCRSVVLESVQSNNFHEFVSSDAVFSAGDTKHSFRECVSGLFPSFFSALVGSHVPTTFTYVDYFKCNFTSSFLHSTLFLSLTSQVNNTYISIRRIDTQTKAKREPTATNNLSNNRILSNKIENLSNRQSHSTTRIDKESCRKRKTTGEKKFPLPNASKCIRMKPKKANNSNSAHIKWLQLFSICLCLLVAFVRHCILTDFSFTLRSASSVYVGRCRSVSICTSLCYINGIAWKEIISNKSTQTSCKHHISRSMHINSIRNNYFTWLANSGGRSCRLYCQQPCTKHIKKSRMRKGVLLQIPREFRGFVRQNRHNYQNRKLFGILNRVDYCLMMTFFFTSFDLTQIFFPFRCHASCFWASIES